MATWILSSVAVLGAALGAFGIVSALRDARRIGAIVCVTLGVATALVASSALLMLNDFPVPFVALAMVFIAAILLGNVFGYPALLVVLFWSGITMLQRENRSLANALALLASIGLLLLPTTLGWLAPTGTNTDSAAYLTRYALHLTIVLLVAYFAMSFAFYRAASWLYQRRRGPEDPEAIIVLGSGLIEGKVPPLLASRLQRALAAYRDLQEAPLIITSGGQGDDEPRPEGIAMREYLLDQGVKPEHVVAETESRTTAENLKFSRKLLSSPTASTLVATNSYHVFRAAQLTRALGMNAHAIGSPTAKYYLPSAILREFVAVLRDNWRIHALCVAALTVIAVIFTVTVVPFTGPPN